jgi:hypothetical protein
LPLSDHFHFGTHPEHGFVATASANMPAHLADWFLTREQFEQVPGTLGLYRLTNADVDGQRRTRQAVHDLREHGYGVQADYSLDPALTPGRPQPVVRGGLMERRSRTARAAMARSPQRGPALTTTPPGDLAADPGHDTKDAARHPAADRPRRGSSPTPPPPNWPPSSPACATSACSSP